MRTNLKDNIKCHAPGQMIVFNVKDVDVFDITFITTVT